MGNVVWAVLDHNSEFSALEAAETVPEPSTLALAALGLATVLLGLGRQTRR